MLYTLLYMTEALIPSRIPTFFSSASDWLGNFPDQSITRVWKKD